MPLSDGEMKVWGEISRQYPVGILPMEFIPIVTDKFRFKEFMLGLGYAAYVPTRYHTHDTIKYPCVLKRAAKHGTGGTGVSIVADQKQLISLTRNVSLEDVLIEEFISSTMEVSVIVVGVRGAAVSLEECIQMKTQHNRFVISDSSKFKQTFVKCTEIPKWTIVKAVSRNIINQLNFTGIGFIQLKYDSSNFPKFIEMNGRRDGMLVNTQNRSLYVDLMKRFYAASIDAGLV